MKPTTWKALRYILLLSFTMPLSALAQDPASPNNAADDGQTKDTTARIGQVVAEPPKSSIQNSTDSKYPCKISASAGNSNIDCGLWLSDLNSSAAPNPGIAWNYAASKLSINIPQQKNSDTTTVGNLDGLASSYTAGFDYTGGMQSVPGIGKLLNDDFLFFDLSVKGGPQHYTYYDAKTLKEESSNKATNSAALSLARLFNGSAPTSSSSALYLTYSSQRTYKDQKSEFECLPSSGAAPLSCANGAIGAPKYSSPRVATLKLASYVPWITNGGISLSVSRDAANQITGVDIPFNFFALSSGGNGSTALSLAIDASWTNDPAAPHRTMLALVIKNDKFHLFPLP